MIARTVSLAARVSLGGALAALGGACSSSGGTNAGDASAGSDASTASDATGDARPPIDDAAGDAACEAPDVHESCLLPRSPDHDYKMCVETSGPWTQAALDSLKGNCEAKVGIWQTTPCIRTGIAGGCRELFTSASTSCPLPMTTWYYANDAGVVTSSFVMSECAQTNATYVAP